MEIRKKDKTQKSLRGMIADIQRASVHDGPGLRTTVFFKGCPLSCEWCHNPECISFEKEVLYYPEKCIRCGMCNEGCYAGARVVCGREYTVEELLVDILLDRDYYGKDGGVTFSGGEPLAQREFLSKMIDVCREEGIHCAVETSLIYYDEEIFRKLDLVMTDLKIWDADIHEKYTGVSNVIIKAHLKKLNTMNIPIIVRTPVIPEIEQRIEQISEFLKGLENIKQYELLPYHPLGESKAVALKAGRKLVKETSDKRAINREISGCFKNFTIPDRPYMKELEKYVFIRG